jgi:small subunit ribosomal protein S17
MTEKRRGRRTRRTGTVVSDKMDKSVVVRVDRIIRHPLYKRYVRRSARFMAHDEMNACKVGDTVEIIEARPLSTRKRWRVLRVIRSTQTAETVGGGQGA